MSAGQSDSCAVEAWGSSVPGSKLSLSICPELGESVLPPGIERWHWTQGRLLRESGPLTKDFPHSREDFDIFLRECRIQ